MRWLGLAVKKETVKSYNIKKELLKNNKINEEFCDQLHNLTLEDIIALKLELASESVKGKFYGFPIKKFINNIINESLIKYSLSAASSYREAGLILGISKAELFKYARKYNIFRGSKKS